MVERMALVSRFVAVITTPGMRALEASVTVPRNELDWPVAGSGVISSVMRIIAIEVRSILEFLSSLFFNQFFALRPYAITS
jgi:hypothetical protein